MSVFSTLAQILFIGHSLVGPDLPRLVESGLALQGARAEVQAQIINGAPLAYNWDHSANAEGVDGKVALAGGEVTSLIMTEAIPLSAQVKWNDTAGQIAAFSAIGREANPGLRVYLYETWHPLNSGPGMGTDDDPNAELPWRERLDADLPVWEQVAHDASAHANGAPVTIIPAGQVLGLLSDELAAGRVPGFTDIRDFFSDDIHLNHRGLYVVALVHMAVLTGQSPEGLPAKLTRSWPSRDAVISEEQALALQRIVWKGVTDYAAGAAAREAKAAATPAPVPEKAVNEVATAAPAQADESEGLGETVVSAALSAGVPDVLPPLPPVRNPNLMIGLAGVNDWSVQQPFLDLMKTARSWTGHLPGQWGGWGHDDLARAGVLGPGGWPRALPPELTGIATLILTDLPPETRGVAGRYLVTWKGQGTLVFDGLSRIVDREDGRLRFDYTPGQGAVIMTMTAIDPADPLRDIVVVREDRAEMLGAGAIFNPDWLARIRGVKGLRFMDWMATNDSALSLAADRPLPGDYTWARVGVPAEVMVALANELDAEPWFTLPHLAEDAFVRDYARIAAEGLKPGLRAWVEYSNEVWNWQFAQARWAEEQGKARWGQEYSWLQFYALRAGEVASIWAEAFAEEPSRLVRVIGTQTGYLGLEEQILTAPLLVAEGRPAPHTQFDAYAVTGYFSGILGAEEKVGALKGWLEESRLAAEAEAARLNLAGRAATDHVASHRFDVAFARAAAELRDGSVLGKPEDTLDYVTGTLFPYHAEVAARYGLDLVMYEGGTHVVGYGPVVEDAAITDFFSRLNYAPEMGALYRDLMAGWAAVTDAPFNAFVDVYAPGKWGSWGALRHLGDENPRWTALAEGCATC
jgi:hypothetical protein